MASLAVPSSGSDPLEVIIRVDILARFKTGGVRVRVLNYRALVARISYQPIGAICSRESVAKFCGGVVKCVQNARVGADGRVDTLLHPTDRTLIKGRRT